MAIEDSSAARGEHITEIQASIDDMQAAETGREAAEVAGEEHTEVGSESWESKLTKLINRVEPGNPDVDDSRESMYPVR